MFLYERHRFHVRDPASIPYEPCQTTGQRPRRLSQAVRERRGGLCDLQRRLEIFAIKSHHRFDSLHDGRSVPDVHVYAIGIRFLAQGLGLFHPGREEEVNDLLAFLDVGLQYGVLVKVDIGGRVVRLYLVSGLHIGLHFDRSPLDHGRTGLSPQVMISWGRDVRGLR